MAIEAVKMGLINGVPTEDEGEALTNARRYLQAMAQKNYNIDFISCTPVQIAGIQSLISTKLVRSKT
jgi:hypothetical protein